MTNTPLSLRQRALSLSPFRRRRKPPSNTAPLLPRINLGLDDEDGDHDHAESNDMNGPTTTWTYEDAARSAQKATPPPPPKMPLYTQPRNVSGPLAVDNTNGMTPEHSATASPWQRTNAAATPNNSKTSQYIERITAENDRLRRELRAEKLAREEEAKRVSAARSKAEDSRSEYQHLQVLADANNRAIERKDRKLEELKATLETESKRRIAAEQRAEEALKMLGDTRSETQRQLASAYEMKHLAETNADAARDGYKRMTDSYEKQVRAMKDELKELRQARIEDADKIRRQAIISDQLQHEMSRTLRSEDKMVNMMGKYKEEHRKEVDSLVQEAQHMRTALPSRERKAEALVTSMEDTRDKMKWVMAQKRRDA